jgi:hypothetical protein
MPFLFECQFSGKRHFELWEFIHRAGVKKIPIIRYRRILPEREPAFGFYDANFSFLELLQYQVILAQVV